MKPGEQHRYKAVEVTAGLPYNPSGKCPGYMFGQPLLGKSGRKPVLRQHVITCECLSKL